MEKECFKARMEAIIAMSREMLCACQTGEWERFHDLEPRRRKEIMALFAAPPLGGETEHVASAISEVIDLDEEIISLCEAEKQSCADRLAEIRHGQRVHHAYQEQQEKQFF